jgi:hypothetical protein
MVDRPRFLHAISDWLIVRPIETLQELRGRTGAHCPSVVCKLALFKLFPYLVIKDSLTLAQAG